MYQVMSWWGPWSVGDVISAGDIAEFCGTEVRPSKVEQKKLGLKDAKGIPHERIAEMIKRGVLRDLDAGEKPLNLHRPTFEERQKILSTLDVARI